MFDYCVVFKYSASACNTAKLIITVDSCVINGVIDTL